MYRLRAGLLAAILAVAGLGGAAAQAAAPKCNLIQDATNDTFLARYQDTAGVYGPQEDALDIVSGDIATDAKTITGVLRVVKLAKTVASAPAGTVYRLQFSIPGLADGTTLFLAASIEGGTEKFLAGTVTSAVAASVSTKLADGTGVFDLAKNEVRIHAPMAAFAAQGDGLKPGTVINLGFDQTTSRFVANNPATGGPVSPFSDVTVPETVYKAGTPSCVKVGK
ncbi:MAG: hypothetical protein ABR520_06935 [Mycobacteriales bacterium]|nr:hypothetical protein [Frankia sp.]